MVGMSLAALDILRLLHKIFFEIMQQIQDIWIFLMASKHAAALSEFGH
jgi:hypothetical protein